MEYNYFIYKHKIIQENNYEFGLKKNKAGIQQQGELCVHFFLI